MHERRGSREFSEVRIAPVQQLCVPRTQPSDRQVELTLRTWDPQPNRSGVAAVRYKNGGGQWTR
jgi:hypothetical protein